MRALGLDPLRRLCCAFTRGGEVLVAVALDGELTVFRLPAGEWRDVVRRERLLLAERG